MRGCELSIEAVRARNSLAFVPSRTLEDPPPLDTLLISGGIGARDGLNRDPRGTPEMFLP